MHCPKNRKSRALVPLLDRFMAFVSPEPNTGCWIWLGAPDSWDYGVFRVGGHLHKAHRVSYELFKGPAGDQKVLHKCDNTFCVNPGHLFLGSDQDNMDDKVKKGRQSKTLTVEEVAEVRRIYRAGGISQDDLGAEYGVSHSLVSIIHRNDEYRSAPEQQKLSSKLV